MSSAFMVKLAVIFFCTLIVSMAVNVQSRNNVAGKYIPIVLTSMLISGLNLTLLRIMPHITTVSEGAAYILGGALGASSALFLHNRYFTKIYKHF